MDRTPAPTPSCASAWCPSSAASTARRSKSPASSFPRAAEQPDFDRLIELAVATIRGLALLDTLHPGDGRNGKQWRYSRARLVELFEAAT